MITVTAKLLSPRCSVRCGPGTSPARRSILVELTPRGRDIFEHAHAELLATEATLLEGLPEKDRSALAKLAASLEQSQDS
jgi:DNA-binding MarR family transcriptional regulator